MHEQLGYQTQRPCLLAAAQLKVALLIEHDTSTPRASLRSLVEIGLAATNAYNILLYERYKQHEYVHAFFEWLCAGTTLHLT